MIFYACPDLQLRSGGVARLYRHVRLLVKNGIEAAILHTQAGFAVDGEPEVPTRYLQIPCLREDDFVVLPEGYPHLMNLVKGLPIRRLAICLNWSYVYRSLQGGKDYRDYNVEAAIVVSPFIGRFITWTMGLPSYVLDYSIDPHLYYDDPGQKVPQVCYIARKQNNLGSLQCALRSRNPRLMEEITWKGLDSLSVRDYASEVRRSMLFLSMSDQEGLTTAMFEAMSAGCLVVGYDGIGGQEELVSSGSRQNSVLAQCGDFITLAYGLEPILDGICGGSIAAWGHVIENGKALVRAHTPESEERSVVQFWRGMLDKTIVPAPPAARACAPTLASQPSVV